MTPWRFLASAGLSGVAIGLFSGCSTLPDPSGSPSQESVPAAAVVERSLGRPPATAVQAGDSTAGYRSDGHQNSSLSEGDARNGDPSSLASLPEPEADPEPNPQGSGVLRDWSDAAVDDPSSRADLWERLRRGLAMPDLDDSLVRHWERFYADKPDYMQRMTERASLYLYHIVDEVERRGMPLELALLPFIESAFNPHAVSTARAMGMWQFMPATGKQFDLKQNLFRDDRRAVQASTRAALDYLQSLHTMFGDWHLALASYNWGEGNVQRALARNRQANKPLAYGALCMPAETRNYVPKLQAIENIVREPARFGLKLPALQNHPFFLSVAVDRDIDVSLITRLADISPEEFRALNPQLNKPVVLAAATPEILLPYDNARRFVRERDRHDGPLASWTAWVAPRTLHPSEAARMVGMTETQLRDVNRVPAQMMIRQGSTLLVTRRPHVEQDVTEKVADSASIQLAPTVVERPRRTVQVGAKATALPTMARALGVTPAELARWNGLKIDAMLKPRQRLVVMSSTTHAKASVKRQAESAAKKTPSKAKQSSTRSKTRSR